MKRIYAICNLMPIYKSWDYFFFFFFSRPFGQLDPTGQRPQRWEGTWRANKRIF